jgi:ABC-type lipoprotein export system ATPase subunit
MIRVRGLTRAYGQASGLQVVLRGLDFEVARGEFVAVMGPSGCGKSTLLGILGLLDRPTEGSYLLAGREAAGMSDAERTAARRRHIGFVFQAFHLLPRLSALDNVCLPMVYAGVPEERRRSWARELLACMGLGAKAEKTPLELSGGERQRVGIARALANRPSVLLADEPTGSLDSRSAAEVMGFFQAFHRAGMTVVLVTHDPAVARRAQRVLHIADGLLSREERPGQRPPAPAPEPAGPLASPFVGSR